MVPVFWRGTVSDVLYAVADIRVEMARVVVDVSDYNFGVSIVEGLNMFDVKLAIEH